MENNNNNNNNNNDDDFCTKFEKFYEKELTRYVEILIDRVPINMLRFLIRYYEQGARDIVNKYKSSKSQNITISNLVTLLEAVTFVDELETESRKANVDLEEFCMYGLNHPHICDDGGLHIKFKPTIPIMKKCHEKNTFAALIDEFDDFCYISKKNREKIPFIEKKPIEILDNYKNLAEGEDRFIFLRSTEIK